MKRRSRKKQVDRITDFLNSVQTVISDADGVVAQLTLAVNAKDEVGIISVEKRAEVNDLHLTALFTVLRDAMQARITSDIGRAGHFKDMVSAEDVDQLELTDDHGRGIKGLAVNPNDLIPF